MFAFCLLWISLAQDPSPNAPPPPNPAAAAPILPALQRAIDGALTACRKLLATDHAFRGSVQAHADATVAAMMLEPTTYIGAAQGPVHLFVLGEQTVLTAAARRLERVRNGAWTLPQGATPDCPLSPSGLAAHLSSATIDAWQAASHDDRPALRVHAAWKGKAAAALIDELSLPDPKLDKMLENIAAISKRLGDDRVTIDASLCYDPATKCCYGATLRIAVLQPDEPLDTDEPAPCPEGLPPLHKTLWFQFVFEVTVLPAANVPMPHLDARLRERLGVPAITPAK